MTTHVQSRDRVKHEAGAQNGSTDLSFALHAAAVAAAVDGVLFLLAKLSTFHVVVVVQFVCSKHTHTQTRRLKLTQTLCVSFYSYFLLAADMEFIEIITDKLERVLLVQNGGREVITIHS